jgi:RNA polymerase sigma-70 factor (ECF subfamily)
LGSFCEEEAIAIEHCRRGSPDAFEVIVRRYMKKAYFIALGLVGNRDDALDLSQEAFFRAYDNINRLHSGRKFFPWFYQILKNLCFSHLRKRRYRRTTAIDDIGQEQIAHDCNEAFGPEAVAERNELKTRVWQAIGKLDNKHREVIILRHFQNLSYEQMAGVLFCSKGTVMSRLYYARRKLKEKLDSEKGGR